MTPFMTWVIGISAFLIAIANIWNFFVRPIVFVRKKKQEHDELEEEKQKRLVRTVLDEEMPRYLDRKFEQIQQDTQATHDILGKVVCSSQDILREKIMTLYHFKKNKRELEWHEKEALERWYIDYKALGGNSYIDKYYRRMSQWHVLEDNYEDE